MIPHQNSISDVKRLVAKFGRLLQRKWLHCPFSRGSATTGAKRICVVGNLVEEGVDFVSLETNGRCQSVNCVSRQNAALCSLPSGMFRCGLLRSCILTLVTRVYLVLMGLVKFLVGCCIIIPQECSKLVQQWWFLSPSKLIRVMLGSRHDDNGWCRVECTMTMAKGSVLRRQGF